MSLMLSLKFEDWAILIAGVCYAAVAVKQGLSWNIPWMVIWTGYAAANFSLTYLQFKG